MAALKKCKVVRSGTASEGVTGLSYARGISAGTVGARGLCLELVVILPGARAKAHLHTDHEAAVYIIGGELVLWFGEGLRESINAGPGDFLYIPDGVPHLPMNRSTTEPVTAVLARTDPNEQESVVRLPELDSLRHLHPPESHSVRGSAMPEGVLNAH